MSISFEKEKITSIIGKNGCGKTTLLKNIMGILPVYEGKITVDGQDIAAMQRKTIAQKIAYLSQSTNVPNITVGQLVLHGRFAHLSYPRVYRQKDREIAIDAMKQMNIEHLSQKAMGTLSGGMRQNAYIAMTLAQNTDYILTDEPTTYLDVSNRLQLMNVFKTLAKGGKGIVAVLHDISLAMQYSDQIVIISDGKIVIADTPENIYHSGIISKIFGVELKRTSGKDGYVYFYDRI